MHGVQAPPLLGLLTAALVLVGAGYLWGRRAPAPGVQAVTSLEGRRAASRGARTEADAAEQRAERIAFWDALSRRVDAEPVERPWCSETEAVIRRVIPAALGPSVTVDAKCASTLCRAKVSHARWPRIPEDEFVRLTLNRESLGTMEIQVDTRAEGVTTLYFLRRAR